MEGKVARYSYYGPDLARVMTLEQMRAKRIEVENAITEIKAAGEWSSVEYNDIINDDNGNQLRVVIDQGDSDKRVHLHIRKRVDGKWKHVGVTTVSDDYRLQKRTTIGSQEGRNE